ncbi:hypothetical protein PNEG_00548 [Pneumocystis murina B123]|uniref:Uncharacterized protein n=1 Tax=Pneumocystis murina (strain B123) TaxID=1069680 RepID=M7NS08_PNEMU|nr:hypothetical protein PNEG_00548 [Pneumocystis murina B123]EMR11538.1 hypothetical protein PNEG_00548 [Pneumocystis murina B123]
MVENEDNIFQGFHAKQVDLTKNLKNKEIFQKHSSHLKSDIQRQRKKQPLEKFHQDHTIPYLRQQIRRIPRSVINRRWTQISESSLIQIVEILKDIQRSVIMSIRHKTRRMDAQRNLNIMINKIRDRISRLLVPSSKEQYNYEKLKEKNQELESILISNLEQISRLEKALNQEKYLLSKEEANFRELTKNAQYDEKSKKQIKRLHPLLRLQDDQIEPKFSYTQINLNENNSLAFDILSDKSFITLERQIKQYVNNMKSSSTRAGKIMQLSQKAQVTLLKILTSYDHFLSRRISIDTCI